MIIVVVNIFIGKSDYSKKIQKYKLNESFNNIFIIINLNPKFRISWNLQYI